MAKLYWAAFGAKLQFAMGPEQKARAFLAENMNPEFALVARDKDGIVRGVAGFKTSEGALTGGNLPALARHYGWLSALWRAPLLTMVERDLTDDELLMDGICVDMAARGKGLGTALLDAVKKTARVNGLASVRLDVIDSNPRARALYEREGFIPMEKEDLGPLRYIFGFRSSTRMLCTLARTLDNTMGCHGSA